MLAAGESVRGRSYDMFMAPPSRRRWPSSPSRSRRHPEAGQKEKLREQLFVQQQYREAGASVKPQPPTITLTDSLTLHRGGREIRLLYLGTRPHGRRRRGLPPEGAGGGDRRSARRRPFLPRRRLRARSGTPRSIGSEALDFDWVLPGHGEAFQGKDKIGHFQSYLADFWKQTRTLHDAGVSAEDAARKIDLRSHLTNYPTAAALKDVGILNHGVFRAYDQIEGRIK